ncbi:MAG: hypothetical protein IT379_26620 [Deltaproteobacteria bacterium]|nr:hypothetical protein [Deltaproteobacteria bacterium]
MRVGSGRLLYKGLALGGLVLAVPLLGGARGDGCAAGSKSPAPNVGGPWDIRYDDRIGVEITIGGATYTEQLGAAGGTFTITHEGRPITFNLDCARPEVICPSEGWPATVDLDQRDPAHPHQFWANLPTQYCDGTMVEAKPEDCGNGTNNPNCDDVCDGEVRVRNEERWGVIGETGETFRLYLGGGLATNGFNCALIGWSVADASLVTTGSSAQGNWEATEMTDGTVTVGFAGGCLWAGDVDMDAELEALLVGASLRFTTGFSGDRK